MKKFLADFKEFAMRGNVLALAVGGIIGGAFKGIVDSLVNDIISPVIGIFAGQNFSDKAVSVGGASIAYGAFITAVLNFIIIAFVLFLLVKSMNKLHDMVKKPGELHDMVKKPGEKKEPRKCPYCLSVIPDKATRCPCCTSELPGAEK